MSLNSLGDVRLRKIYSLNHKKQALVLSRYSKSDLLKTCLSQKQFNNLRAYTNALEVKVDRALRHVQGE